MNSTRRCSIPNDRDYLVPHDKKSCKYQLTHLFFAGIIIIAIIFPDPFAKNGPNFQIGCLQWAGICMAVMILDQLGNQYFRIYGVLDTSELAWLQTTIQLFCLFLAVMLPFALFIELNNQVGFPTDFQLYLIYAECYGTLVFLGIRGLTHCFVLETVRKFGTEYDLTGVLQRLANWMFLFLFIVLPFTFVFGLSADGIWTRGDWWKWATAVGILSGYVWFSPLCHTTDYWGFHGNEENQMQIFRADLALKLRTLNYLLSFAVVLTPALIVGKMFTDGKFTNTEIMVWTLFEFAWICLEEFSLFLTETRLQQIGNNRRRELEGNETDEVMGLLEMVLLIGIFGSGFGLWKAASEKAVVSDSLRTRIGAEIVLVLLFGFLKISSIWNRLFASK